MADRPLAEPQREAPPGDESRVARIPRAPARTAAPYALAGVAAGARAHASRRPRPVRACRGSSCRRAGTARVAPARPPRPRSIAATVGASRVAASPAREAGLDERRAVQRPDAPPTAATSRWPTARRSSPGERLGAAARPSSSSTARKPMTRLSPWSPSPRTASSRVSCALRGGRRSAPQRASAGAQRRGVGDRSRPRRPRAAALGDGDGTIVLSSESAAARV